MHRRKGTIDHTNIGQSNYHNSIFDRNQELISQIKDMDIRKQVRINNEMPSYFKPS